MIPTEAPPIAQFAAFIVKPHEVGKLKRIGRSDEFEILRDGGRAALLCWPCDRERRHSIPWQNALATFRGLDEPQRYPEVGKSR